MATWSVVIATHTEERWHHLKSAAESALSQTLPPEELIIAVDHNESLLSRAKMAFDGRVRVMANQEAKGASGCRNTATRVAVGSHVAYLDDDAVADRKWLAFLDDAFSDGVIGVGGLAVPDWESGSEPGWLPEEFYWVVGCHYEGHRTDAGPIRAPIGANMAFEKSTYLDAGGLSSTFTTPPFNRCEEVEFSLRLLEQTGRSIHFAPDAVVYHSVPSDRTTWRYFASRCLLEGRAKAAVTVASGFKASTAVERRYVTRTLAPSVLRHLGRGLRGRSGELAKAFNVVIGLLLTSVGFAHGQILLKLYVPEERATLTAGPHRPVT